VCLVVLALAPLGAPAQAKRAPALSIEFSSYPNDPIEVPLPGDVPATTDLYYTLHVTGGPATNVTVTVTGAGLALPPPKNFGNINGEWGDHVSVAALTGGFHQLVATVTADGAAPSQAVLNYLWAPTGAMTVSPTQDLQFTYFGTTGLYAENGTSFEDRAELLFLTQDTAYYGVPTKGLPKCKTGSTTATSGCLTYAYDTSTHLIQIGGSIGTVDKRGVHTIGLGVADYQDGEDFAHRDWTQQLMFPNNHNRYAGTWRWVYDNYCPDCFTFAKLTLRKDGTFALLDNFKRKRLVKGRYDVSHLGRLVLTGNFGKTHREIHTLGVYLDKKGKPAPSLGLALTFGKGSNSDVVFLKPVRK
jgi:hypothetical protein